MRVGLSQQSYISHIFDETLHRQHQNRVWQYSQVKLLIPKHVEAASDLRQQVQHLQDRLMGISSQQH